MVPRMLTTELSTQVSEELLKRYRRDPATFISQLVIQDETWIITLRFWNKACNGTKEVVRIVISLHCVTPYSARQHVICVARLCYRPFVRRPSHRWIIQKRLKLGSRDFYHTVAHLYSFCGVSFIQKFQRVPPSRGVD